MQTKIYVLSILCRQCKIHRPRQRRGKQTTKKHIRSLLRILPRGRELAKIHIGEAANPLQMTIHWSDGSSWITAVVQIVFEIHLRIEACDSWLQRHLIIMFHIKALNSRTRLLCSRRCGRLESSIQTKWKVSWRLNDGDEVIMIVTIWSTKRPANGGNLTSRRAEQGVDF